MASFSCQNSFRHIWQNASEKVVLEVKHIAINKLCNLPILPRFIYFFGLTSLFFASYHANLISTVTDIKNIDDESLETHKVASSKENQRKVFNHF